MLAILTSTPRFPANSVDAYKKAPYSIWDFFPASWSCPHEMERIGRLGDGGKWVCGFSLFEKLPKEKKCVVYSFGVQEESSYGTSFLFGQIFQNILRVRTCRANMAFPY
jgi:hypothetical protein